MYYLLPSSENNIHVGHESCSTSNQNELQPKLSIKETKINHLSNGKNIRSNVHKRKPTKAKVCLLPTPFSKLQNCPSENDKLSFFFSELLQGETSSILRFLQTNSSQLGQTSSAMEGGSLTKSQNRQTTNTWGYNLDEIDQSVVDELPREIQEELYALLPRKKANMVKRGSSIAHYFSPK